MPQDQQVTVVKNEAIKDCPEVSEEILNPIDERHKKAKDIKDLFHSPALR